MREANHRAAVQIFERVNSSLLPNNILDLHGLHVDEALEHLAQVLQDKTTGNELFTVLYTYNMTARGRWDGTFWHRNVYKYTAVYRHPQSVSENI